MYVQGKFLTFCLPAQIAGSTNLGEWAASVEHSHPESYWRLGTSSKKSQALKSSLETVKNGNVLPR